jgi:hypothetical protein
LRAAGLRTDFLAAGLRTDFFTDFFAAIGFLTFFAAFLAAGFLDLTVRFAGEAFLAAAFFGAFARFVVAIGLTPLRSKKR